jgi:hypothetical protein
VAPAKAKKEPAPKKIAPAVKAKKETTKKAPTTKKASKKAASEAAAHTPGGGARHQSLGLIFAIMSDPRMNMMDKTSSTGTL